MNSTRKRPTAPAQAYWNGTKRVRRHWRVQRSRLEVLRDRSIERDDLGTARACLAALRLTSPWQRPVERHEPLSPAEVRAVQRVVQRARRGIR